MIGIIGAMEYEVSLLKSKMVGMYSDDEDGRFFCGELAGVDCVIAQCGIGKVNAAITATLMIERYHPYAIINTGVGGGLAPDLEIGDIVVAESLVEHDLDYGILGDKRGSIFFFDNSSLINLPVDGDVNKILLSAGKKLNINVRQGIIASGDRFVSDGAIKADIRSCFNADVCEMEGAAIAHAAYAQKTKVAVIRSVSDRADGGAPDDFTVFGKRSAQKAASLLMESLPMISLLSIDYQDDSEINYR